MMHHVQRTEKAALVLADIPTQFSSVDQDISKFICLMLPSAL